MFKATLSLIVFFIGLNSFAKSGDGIGNGGDGIRTLFKEAKEIAIRNLERLDDCTLRGIDPETKNWLLVNRLKLAVDIHKSEHIWDDKSAKGKCAGTGNRAGQPIVFRELDCKIETYTPDSAARLLVHEAVHHWDIPDDERRIPDRVADAVYDSSAKSVCHLHPWTVDTCPVDYGLPPRMTPPSRGPFAEAPLGTYRMFYRTRLCDRDDCGIWAERNIAEKTFADENAKPIKLPVTGKVSLVVDSENQAFLLTAGNRLCGANKRAICEMGIGANNLYDTFRHLRRKISFVSTYKTDCLRQYAKVQLRDPDATEWIENEYLIIWNK
jgi:hypothetical protein